MAIPLTIRIPDRGVELLVELQDETFRLLVGEVRLARPPLANRLEWAALDHGLLEVHDVDAATLEAPVPGGDFLDAEPLGNVADLVEV